jgi:hypothetical protein
MIACIRYFCASFLFLALLSANEGSLVEFPFGAEAEYESHILLDSSWVCEGNEVPFHGELLLQGTMGLDSEVKQTGPLSFHFILSNLTYRLNGQEHNLQVPGHITELIELVRWKGKSLPFQIIDQYPYLEFSPRFKERYEGLKVFSSSFSGYFAEDLSQLIRLNRLILRLNEPVEYTEDVPFQRKHVVTLTEINDSEIVIEVVSLLDRQKKLFGLSGAVIWGSSKQTWTINRHNGLIFGMEENGTMCTIMKINGCETKQTHQVKRTTLSTPKL